MPLVCPGPPNSECKLVYSGLHFLHLLRQLRAFREGGCTSLVVAPRQIGVPSQLIAINVSPSRRVSMQACSSHVLVATLFQCGNC
jgi:hypothetical protein